MARGRRRRRRAEIDEARGGAFEVTGSTLGVTQYLHAFDDDELEMTEKAITELIDREARVRRRPSRARGAQRWSNQGFLRVPVHVRLRDRAEAHRGRAADTVVGALHPRQQSEDHRRDRQKRRDRTTPS